MIILFGIKIKGIEFGVSFSFFAVIALLFVCGGAQTENIFTALLCCALHEMGHLMFMFLFANKPQSIILYGGGIRIRPSVGKMLSKNQDIIILLAGCGVNFICALVWYMLYGADLFFGINMLLGVFNLLPFGYFDGGRVLKIVLDDSAACDIIKAVFIFMSAVCIILMNLNGVLSISFMLTFCFVAASELVH